MSDTQTAVSDQLQQQVVAWSEMLRNGALSVADLAKEQVPGVIREMIVYGRVSWTVALCACLVAGYIIQRIFRSAWNSKERDCGEMTTGNMVVCLVCGFAAIPCAIMLVESFAKFSKVWFAPRLYLIEEFSRILS